MRTLASLASMATLAVLAGPSIAAQTNVLDPIVVTATRIAHDDVDAPYASEVHTSAQIQQSGANDLYDYLDKRTSLTVLPSFGNPFSRKIDMRGFGIGDGFQNIAITVDGRRLNNIDMVPQLLSAIPLDTIDRIEITKGSGSVVYGDGATAGSIQIYTKSLEGLQASAGTGNHGVRKAGASAGFASDYYEVSLYADTYQQDGFSQVDTAGFKDQADSETGEFRLKVYPTDSIEIRAGAANSEIDTRYPGPLTLAEFSADPSQNGGNAYTHQIFDTEGWNVGVTADINQHLSINLSHYVEDKRSDFVSFAFAADYEYTQDRVEATYNNGPLTVVTGFDLFDGDRIQTTSTTAKDNTAVFLQGDYRIGDTLISAGLRKDDVEYTHTPSGGTSLKGDHELSAWDLGVNHRYSRNLSLFANLNSSYQAPDIDRFFTFSGTFNGFIVPATVKTLSIGANHRGKNNKLKATVFYSKLKDEIYFEPLTFTNTNIDRSHKYGVEIQETHRFNEAYTGRINYTFTRAIIDNEDEGSGAYDGKDLPGVPRHSLVLSLDYDPAAKSRLSVSHTYRSDAHSAEDFSNSAAQKQKSYSSTDISYFYRVSNNLELVATVENLFEEANGIWIRDDAIFPVNFTRNWFLGLRASL